jgi:hypothetical protein
MPFRMGLVPLAPPLALENRSPKSRHSSVFLGSKNVTRCLKKGHTAAASLFWNMEKRRPAQWTAIIGSFRAGRLAGVDVSPYHFCVMERVCPGIDALFPEPHWADWPMDERSFRIHEIGASGAGRRRYILDMALNLAGWNVDSDKLWTSYMDLSKTTLRSKPSMLQAWFVFHFLRHCHEG